MISRTYFMYGFSDELSKVAKNNSVYTGPRTYSTNGNTYDVYALWRLSKRLPEEKISITSDEIKNHRKTKSWNNGKSIDDVLKSKDDSDGHMDRINSAELKYPILGTPDGKIADGKHRIAKAVHRGIGQIGIKRFKSWKDMDPALVKRKKDVGQK